MCEYCSKKGVNTDFEHLSVSDGICNVRLYSWCEGTKTSLEVVTETSINDLYINYCPMCGRYLKED